MEAAEFESARGRNHLAGTNIPSALSIRKYIRQKYKKYVTHHAKKFRTNSDKFREIQIGYHTFCNYIRSHRAPNIIKHGPEYLQELIPNTSNDSKTCKQIEFNVKTKTMLNVSVKTKICLKDQKVKKQNESEHVQSLV